MHICTYMLRRKNKLKIYIPKSFFLVWFGVLRFLLYFCTCISFLKVIEMKDVKVLLNDIKEKIFDGVDLSGLHKMTDSEQREFLLQQQKRTVSRQSG